MSRLIKVEEFNDPGCPFGYSAEQHRRRIQWLYGEELDTELRLIGLHGNPEEMTKRGFTPEKMMGGWRKLAASHGMPFNFAQPERHSATIPACRAVVATRVHGGNDRALMRWLRIKRFSGELIDEQSVIDDAARSAGIDTADLAKWSASAEADKALKADMDAARSPDPAALAVDHRLADWEGGRRYTCPTWEIDRLSDSQRFVFAGFQPFDVYEVAFANLLPQVERRAPATDPLEAISWAGEPLATREVALVMGIDDEAADDALRGSGATEIPLQSSSFWVR